MVQYFPASAAELQQAFDRYLAQVNERAADAAAQAVTEQLENIVRQTIRELRVCGFITSEAPAMPDLVEHVVAMLNGK